MNKVLLIVGIVITGLSLLTFTIFSLSGILLKIINRHEEKEELTPEEKRKKKIKKKLVKFTKKLIKMINKNMVRYYWLMYILAGLSFAAGATLTTVATVNIIQENEKKDKPGEDPTDPVNPPAPITYKITWKDEDGSILYQNQVEEGKLPTYNRELPYKEPSDNKNFVFDVWSPAPRSATSDAVYTATYREATNIFKLYLYSEYFYPPEDPIVREVLEGTRLFDHWLDLELTFQHPDPTYQLDKLYDNPELEGEPYDIYAPIVKEMTLYPSYIKYWTITYNVDHSGVDLERVKEGECAIGYVWQYEDYTWFDRENPSVPFDFANTPIYSDYVLDGYLI